MDRNGLLKERLRLSSLLEQETHEPRPYTVVEPGLVMAKRLREAVRNSIDEIDRMLKDPKLNF
jgi:hypothetical protein